MRRATSKNASDNPSVDAVETYRKPELIRYGTFRELTRIGFGADGDGGFMGLLDGCSFGCGPDPSRS